MPRSRKYMTPAEAREASLFPRSILRREFRLKPAKGQRAAATVWQGQGVYYVFAKAACIPMRPYRVPSPTQAAALAAGRALAGTLLCKTCGNRVGADCIERGRCYDCIGNEQREREREIENEARAVAVAWLSANPVFVDSETTGLDDTDQVCEIAILDVDGTVLFSSLVRPSCAMNPAAASVHGITPEELADAPTWPHVHDAVAEILAGRLVIAHNADFDSRLLTQTCRAYGLDTPSAEWDCTQALLTPLNGGRWPRLSKAVAIAGADVGAGAAHRAVRDADTVRRIVLALGKGSMREQKPDHLTPAESY